MNGIEGETSEYTSAAVNCAVGVGAGVGVAVGVGVGVFVGVAGGAVVGVAVGSGVGTGSSLQALRTTAMARTATTASQRMPRGDTVISVVGSVCLWCMPMVAYPHATRI